MRYSPNQISAGSVFGKLTVIGEAGKDCGNNRLFECRCTCGNISTPRGCRLLSGKTLACKKCGKIKHGEAKNITKEFRAWCHIRDRCNNPSNKSYINYGGKGVKVCDRWANSFENFLMDVGRAPSSNHTLDRFPDNEGNYEPGNVRWANWFEQQGNRTNNKWLEHQGQRHIMADWSKMLNIEYSLFGYHIRTGKTIDQILKPKSHVAASK